MSLSGLKQQEGVLGTGKAVREGKEDSNTDQPQNEIALDDFYDSVHEMSSELDTLVIDKPSN